MSLSRRTLLLSAGATSLGLVTGCSTGEPAATGSTSSAALSFTDGLGRSISMPGPARKAVVVSRYTNELIRAIGSIDQVIGVDMNTAQDRVYWPQFDPKEVISSPNGGLNHEQILKLEPDVLIEGSPDKIEGDAAKLSPAGITTVGVVPWDNKNFGHQIEVLGKTFGNEDGAKKVLDFFTSKMDLIRSSVDGAKPVKVYWEYGDPFTTCVPGTSNQGWYDMILAAGGQSIFDDSKTGKTVDPEKILEADPDVIIKTTSGRALKNTGIYTPPTQEEFASIWQEMAARPGWKDLSAVKNGRVYLTTGFCGGGLGKMVGAAFASTWFHPERTKQIDPDKIFAEWMAMQSMKPIPGHVYHPVRPA